MEVNLFQYKTQCSQIPFIYSVCFAYPLHRYGRQQLCSLCNAPLTKHLTLLTQPAFECTATDSRCSSQLTLQVTFHLAFTIYWFTIYHLTISCAPTGAQAQAESHLIIYHLPIYHLPFTISSSSSSFISMQRYKKSTNFARKFITFSKQ